MPLIEATNLRKVYKSSAGPVVALDDLNLTVEEGTVRGILGPNGAGKTTTVKVLTTLLQPDAGAATIDGIDVLREPDAVRRIIGASGQYAALDEKLTARENLELFGRLYHLGRATARERAAELLEAFDLTEAADRPLKGYSGGMRRRIDLAGSIIIEPRVLFLDEPTTGLDPQSRLGLWDIIRNRVAQGTTVLLTTQYLEEADQLADDISVIDHGKVIAEGTADELKAAIGQPRIEIIPADRGRLPDVQRILSQCCDGEIQVEGGTAVGAVSNATTALQEALRLFEAEGIELFDAGLRRPTLDDVFLQLTGRTNEQA
ncbi:daunorubicin resistance protein DrrA family ABC transporter ATP-binding protein [Corynebacterium ulceribovis]|uniref:daunorubicin resistance protein DrrA family ABC transporter ATP-binding protein n=1 Tax=Corynebacterium ulceribovis TaxID=487732 RepID=UPI0003778A2F|nr:daunorubicin resistance protein DrrA family ABC transporter ATP-binding protein [Corynebacterium ulceribovis]